MRTLVFPLAFVLAAPAATAQVTSPPPAPPSPPPFVAAPTPEQQVAELREQLLASQQQITRLEQQVAEERSRSAALTTCRARNARLVTIGQQLIDEYERRYRRSHHDPLQLGRRRFEAELQDTQEAIYDSRADVPAPAPPAAASKGN
jgi:hypothetical protein